MLTGTFIYALNVIIDQNAVDIGINDVDLYFFFSVLNLTFFYIN